MCFPHIVKTDEDREKWLRTDESFRNRLQPNHHSEYSILEQLPIDMIRSFPTSDALHLLDLGITKRWHIFDVKTSLFNYSFITRIQF